MHAYECLQNIADSKLQVGAARGRVKGFDLAEAGHVIERPEIHGDSV